MGEVVKSPSLLNAELADAKTQLTRVKARAVELESKIERLEEQLVAAWSTPIVGVCMVIVFVVGFLTGTIF